MAQVPDSLAKFLDRFAEAWATNDGEEVAALFADDGSLVNPFGQRADGRAAVATMYREYFDGMLSGTSTTLLVESSRHVGDMHMFADAEQTISGPDGGVVLVAHLAALLSRDGEDWRFVDSRPYTFGTLPG